MTREEAEVWLQEVTVGSYIVRESTTKPGDISISVKLHDGVSHIKIRRADVCLCLLSGPSGIGLPMTEHLDS
jgi:hypothetical protein